MTHLHGRHPLAAASWPQAVRDGSGRLGVFAADPHGDGLLELRQDAPDGPTWSTHAVPL